MAKAYILLYGRAPDYGSGVCGFNSRRGRFQRLFGLDTQLLLRLARFADQDVGKSGIPRAPGARDRWFESSRPDFIDPVWPNGKAAAC